MKFRDFIPILEANGFTLDRQGATSHRQYKGIVDGKVMLVTVDWTNPLRGSCEDRQPAYNAPNIALTRTAAP